LADWYTKRIHCLSENLFEKHDHDVRKTNTMDTVNLDILEQYLSTRTLTPVSDTRAIEEKKALIE
jgi:hypothetical protein